MSCPCHWLAPLFAISNTVTHRSQVTRDLEEAPPDQPCPTAMTCGPFAPCAPPCMWAPHLPPHPLTLLTRQLGRTPSSVFYSAHSIFATGATPWLPPHLVTSPVIPSSSVQTQHRHGLLLQEALPDLPLCSQTVEPKTAQPMWNLL